MMAGRRWTMSVFLLGLAMGLVGCGPAGTNAGSRMPPSAAQADQPSAVPAAGDSVCTILPAEVIHNSNPIIYRVSARAPNASLQDDGSKLSMMTVDGVTASCSYGNAATDKQGRSTDGTPYFYGHVEVTRVSNIDAQYGDFLQGDVCMQREQMSPGSCPMTALGNATAFEDIYQGRSDQVWTVFLMNRSAIVTATWPSSTGIYSPSWMKFLADRLTAALH